MKTTWRLIGLFAILAAAFTAAPAVAADSDVPKSKDLAEMQKQLDRIEASLAKVQGLKVDVDELRERVRFERTVTVAGMERDIVDLQKQVARLTEEIERMRTLPPPAGGRTSFYAGPGPGPAVASGAIRLRNTYLEPVTIAINNRMYDVAPGADLVLNNQPAGEFTYEVLGIQMPVRRTLLANRTFYIDVFPR